MSGYVGKPLLSDHDYITGEDKTSLNELDLFDRVVNVKFTTTNGDVFVVRSDYETFFPELSKSVVEGKVTDNTYRKCFVRKCQYKPDIKVQYKRVSADTGITIDLFMSNFYMISEDGTTIQNFSSINYPLQTVQIALGYFGMFKNTMSGSSNISISELFDFSSERLQEHGITVLTMSGVEYTQTDKLPPDSVIHVHGFVSQFYSPNVLTLAKGIPDNYKDLFKDTENHARVVTYTEKSTANARDTMIGATMYKYITQKFVNQNKYVELCEKRKKKVTLVYAKNEDTGVEDVWTGFLGTDNYVLNDSEASLYGVNVYYTKGALEFMHSYDESKGVKTTKDEEGNTTKVASAFAVKQGVTAWGTLRNIKTTLGITNNLLTIVLNDGNLLMFAPYEARSVDKAIEGTEVADLFNVSYVSTFWKDKLPAVYNITTDALCTITCPFFFTINPFQRFYFESRYTLGGLVSYFANYNSNINEFYALWQTISFATVEDVNECTIVCVGKEKTNG